jgi:hypothetical protein
LGEGLEAWWWIGWRRRRRRRRRGFWHGGSAMGIGVETGRVGGCVNSNYVEFVVNHHPSFHFELDLNLSKIIRESRWKFGNGGNWVRKV